MKLLNYYYYISHKHYILINLKKEFRSEFRSEDKEFISKTTLVNFHYFNIFLHNKLKIV